MAIDKNTMFEIIKDVEDNKLTPYYDSKGRITLGVGFNISDVKNKNNELRNKVFLVLGIAEKRNGSLESKILYKADGTINELVSYLFC